MSAGPSGLYSLSVRRASFSCLAHPACPVVFSGVFVCPGRLAGRLTCLACPSGMSDPLVWPLQPCCPAWLASLFGLSSPSIMVLGKGRSAQEQALGKGEMALATYLTTLKALLPLSSGIFPKNGFSPCPVVLVPDRVIFPCPVPIFCLPSSPA